MQSSIIKHLSHGGEANSKGNSNIDSWSSRNDNGNADAKSTSSLTCITESKKPVMLNGDMNVYSSKPKYNSRLPEMQNTQMDPLSPAVGYSENKAKNCSKNQRKRYVK